LVEWPRGEATACKAVYTGSNPVSTSARSRAISSAGERFPDTEEVTGSIPVSPTSKTAGQIARYRILVTGYSLVAPYGGSKLGAQDRSWACGAGGVVGDRVGFMARGFDAGKKVNGRKRHIAVDTTGWLLIVLVTSAGVQDRHGARLLLWALAGCFARIGMVWVDGGYSGAPVEYGLALGLGVHVVAKLAGQIGFTVLPRRWVVERTLAWINRCRRTTRDYERLPEHHSAMVQWSMVVIMARRLARYQRRALQPRAE
jgi:transposase